MHYPLIIAYSGLVIQQAVFPTVFLVWQNYPLTILYIYPFVSLITISFLIYAQKLSPQQIIQQQSEYLLSYALISLNIYFSWHIYDIANHSEFSPSAFVTYSTLFFCSLIYSILTITPLNTLKYMTVQGCAIVRLFFYAIQTAQAIEVQGEIKDFYLLFMATQIAVYAFYIQQVKKAWHKTQHSINHTKNQTLISQTL